MSITYPVGLLVDNSGAILNAPVVTVTAIYTPSGSSLSTGLATVNGSGTAVPISIAYDPVTNGEAWIVYSVSQSGKTVTGQNATGAVFAAIDSATVAKFLFDANSNVKTSISAILATALTETTGGNLAAAFKKLLDVGTPVLTAASVNQSGDAYGRLGAAGAGLTSLGDSRLGNLDAAVSSRSTYAGADTAGTTTLLSRLGVPTGASIAADIAQVEGHATNTDSQASTLLNLLGIVAGLVGMNCGVRNTAYTGSVLTSADICLYDSPAHAALNDGSTGLLHRFALTGGVNGTNAGNQSVSLAS